MFLLQNIAVFLTYMFHLICNEAKSVKKEPVLYFKHPRERCTLLREIIAIVIHTLSAARAFRSQLYFKQSVAAFGSGVFLMSYN